jgi:hypothetical protein
MRRFEFESWHPVLGVTRPKSDSTLVRLAPSGAQDGWQRRMPVLELDRSPLKPLPAD